MAVSGAMNWGGEVAQKGRSDLEYRAVIRKMIIRPGVDAIKTKAIIRDFPVPLLRENA
jgi:hypothetical protein